MAMAAWKTDTERMEQKSALHRLRKRIPMVGYEFNDEDDSDVDLSQPTEAVVATQPAEPVPEPPPQKRRPRALQAVVDAPAVQQEPPQPPPPDDTFDGDVI